MRAWDRCQTFVIAPTPTPTITPSPTVTPLPRCADGEDNDNDGRIDLGDPGCQSLSDASEEDSCGNEFKLYYNVEDRVPERFAAVGKTATSPVVVGKSAMIYSGDFELPLVDPGASPHCGHRIPQEAIGNIDCHLDLLDANLPWRMSAATEVVIIDIEAWDPVWETLPTAYKQASKQRVVAQNPTWTDDVVITAEARRQWTTAATEFFLAILNRIKQRYPQAKVGFYDLPRHYLYNYGYQGVYGDMYRSRSDQLEQIWRAVDILAPETYLHVPVGSVYPNGYVQTELDNSFFIGDAVQEAIRIRDTYPNNQMIITIGWHRYHDSARNPYRAQFLNPVDLQNQLFYSRAFGAQGTFMWGREVDCLPSDFNYPDCLAGPPGSEYADYFSTLIDPIVRQQCSTAE